jgi:methionine--tRNA ligase beta chain
MSDTDNTPRPEDTPCCGDSAPCPEPAPAPDEATPEAPTIQYDDFAKVQLRVARVLEVSEHPNADKLIVLRVDLGDEQRTICAGIKAFYAPEELLGKNIVVVANLAPRKLRGIESHGMLLASHDAGSDDVVVLTTDKLVAPGSSVS